MFKLVPGVWAESSGGVSGANVFVRGFPGGGDAPFLTVQVNGAPIFPPPTLSFLENSTLFRIDETVQRMEALRGGPNPVFSNGQPGLTTNFILREGSEDTEGLIKFTTSDYDLRRFDGYVSGELADEFYYMVGGYITSSPGIRDSSFNSDEGSQFTINLTKNLEQGSVNLFHRQTDDHGTWYLPAAVNVPGIDAGYNQLGTLNRQRRILFANAGGDADFVDPAEETLDLGEGRGWDGSVTGVSFVFDITDAWRFTNRASFTAGDADTLGLVPNGDAVQIGALRADQSLDATAVITGDITGAVSGRDIGDDEYIQQFGAWVVRKGIEAFTNDLSFEYSWDTGSATFGYYAANSSTDEFWSLGNFKYEVVQAGGEVVTGIGCNDDDFRVVVDPDTNEASNVETCAWNYDIDATGDATANAFYAATSFDIGERLTLDFGVRQENHEVEYSVDEGLDGAVTLALSTDESEVSWTAAGNFAFSETLGAFLRLNQGSRMPYFDDYRDNRGAFANGNILVQDVEQVELGAKWVTDDISVYATGFFTKVDPSIFVALTGADAGVISTNEAIGVEIDANWATAGGFNLNLNATIQDSEVKAGAHAGNETQRQPAWQLRLTPSYNFAVGSLSEVSIYGTLSAVDDRFSDPANEVRLAGYEKLDLGILARVNERFSVQLSADNITDEQGLTEGDPRDPAAANVRFIMPRSIKFSVGYEF